MRAWAAPSSAARTSATTSRSVCSSTRASSSIPTKPVAPVSSSGPESRGGGGHAASRHSDALWPPNPNEFDSATGGRPLDISSGRAVPGT